jgi:membrane-bound lytic murein transglycosylase D
MNKIILVLVVISVFGCSYNVFPKNRIKKNEEITFNEAGRNVDSVKIDSLNQIIDTQMGIIDSLQTLIDTLYFQIDSLNISLDDANSRLTVNPNFEIPDSVFFAGQKFYLKNDRIRTKFEKIFNSELKHAHRFIPRSGKYFALIDSIFTEEKIPLDAKYLAVAESYLNPMATSSVGAAGMWQFMRSTGKGYGLKVNSYIDERRNIFKSTKAAAKYLKNSYRYLKRRRGVEDWLLAMCSYNAGVGSISKVVKQQGGKTFSDLILRVDETNKYLWRAIAIKIIFLNEKKIFGKTFARDEYIYDVVRKVHLRLNGYYKIDQWAKMQGTVISKVWENNPWIKIYKRRRKKYSPINDVVLPKGEFDILLPKNSVPNIKQLAFIEKQFLKKNSGYYQYHIVKKGDSLYRIAKKYHTTIYKIKIANNLHSNTIRPGQKLRLFGSNVTSYKKNKNRIYKVKSGDSISKISQKLGVSSKTLVAKNHLTIRKKNGKTIINIYPGQELRY